MVCDLSATLPPCYLRVTSLAHTSHFITIVLAYTLLPQSYMQFLQPYTQFLQSYTQFLQSYTLITNSRNVGSISIDCSDHGTI